MLHCWLDFPGFPRKDLGLWRDPEVLKGRPSMELGISSESLGTTQDLKRKGTMVPHGQGSWLLHVIKVYGRDIELVHGAINRHSWGSTTLYKPPLSYFSWQVLRGFLWLIAMFQLFSRLTPRLPFVGWYPPCWISHDFYFLFLVTLTYFDYLTSLSRSQEVTVI